MEFTWKSVVIIIMVSITGLLIGVPPTIVLDCARSALTYLVIMLSLEMLLRIVLTLIYLWEKYWLNNPKKTRRKRALVRLTDIYYDRVIKAYPYLRFNWDAVVTAVFLFMSFAGVYLGRPILGTLMMIFITLRTWYYIDQLPIPESYRFVVWILIGLICFSQGTNLTALVLPWLMLFIWVLD